MRLTSTILICCLLLCGCQSGPVQDSRHTETQENGEPVHTFLQARWTETLRHGTMQFEAGKLVMKGEPMYRRVLLHDMRMVLRDSIGNERLRVAAGNLFLLPNLDHVELSQNVLVSVPTGVELEADSLEFHLEELLLEGSGNVRLISDKYILEGSAIISNINLSAYEVMGLKGYVNLETDSVPSQPAGKADQ
jgi:hypothetical protein